MMVIWMLSESWYGGGARWLLGPSEQEKHKAIYHQVVVVVVVMKHGGSAKYSRALIPTMELTNNHKPPRNKPHQKSTPLLLGPFKGREPSQWSPQTSMKTNKPYNIISGCGCVGCGCGGGYGVARVMGEDWIVKR